MSMTIGNGFGILPTLIANSSSVHRRLDTLTEQASTSLAADTYAGLGGQASTSIDLAQQLGALQTYQRNIGQATASMTVTQTAMTEIQKIASRFASGLPNLNGLNPSEIDSVAGTANAALQEVAQLLNTKDGNKYVFGGQDSENPPVSSADDILSSGFYTQINAAVAGLSANGPSTTAASTLAIARSNAAGTSPFSAYMSQSGLDPSPPQVQIGPGLTTPAGLLASANSVAISSGSSTTGSYMRDLMRALATLGSMSSKQAGDSGFGALVSDVGTSLTGAISAMAVDVGIFGNKQASLTATQARMSDSVAAISSQLSSIQNVDMATVLSQLTATQTQLEASYRLISQTHSLSLVNFISA